jgi:hypothetical protein
MRIAIRRSDVLNVAGEVQHFLWGCNSLCTANADFNKSFGRLSLCCHSSACSAPQLYLCTFLKSFTPTTKNS